MQNRQGFRNHCNSEPLSQKHVLSLVAVSCEDCKAVRVLTQPASGLCCPRRDHYRDAIWSAVPLCFAVFSRVLSDSSMQGSSVGWMRKGSKPVTGSTGSEMTWTAERLDVEARKLWESQVFLTKVEASLNYKGCQFLLELPAKPVLHDGLFSALLIASEVAQVQRGILGSAAG